MLSGDPISLNSHLLTVVSFIDYLTHAIQERTFEHGHLCPEDQLEEVKNCDVVVVKKLCHKLLVTYQCYDDLLCFRISLCHQECRVLLTYVSNDLFVFKLVHELVVRIEE